MSDLPKPESDIPSERDHGELFRRSTRQLPTTLMKTKASWQPRHERKQLLGFVLRQ
jgi:hypothetical protein